ncbi:MAG: nucleotidyl transferase AbiEii/AbiGii toxin family protein [Arachnia propionica]|uniref:nucleotidyl transferase AbiEii/AbiGii toxin family protein n=1 Tax=Arachnia propionica TaxID=1750 RepID=UPI0026FA7E10|nr:nucleotidyl transferase AbiEii/AbiGii toxin family protein [Arachnia propionica]
MTSVSGAQQEVTRIALHSVKEAGFALAGSGAIRAHGLTERPTEDVDLFTSNPEPETFDNAVDQVMRDLRQAGCVVEVERRAAGFTRLQLRTPDGVDLDLDMGIDWREREPVALEVGPVLAVEDAVGNKISALYSRAEPRDYLDVDSIRQAGIFTDQELLEAAAERDPGFDSRMFATQLAAVQRVTPRDVVAYSVSATELEALKERIKRWVVSLEGSEELS